MNTYSENYYIVHLNVSPKTLTAGQKYYDNGEIVMDSEAWFYQFADYIFFNGYSFKDLIEKDPDIFVGIQASNGRTDNLEFTLSPAALAKNKVPYFGTTGKGETIDLRARLPAPQRHGNQGKRRLGSHSRQASGRSDIPFRHHEGTRPLLSRRQCNHRRHHGAHYGTHHGGDAGSARGAYLYL